MSINIKSIVSSYPCCNVSDLTFIVTLNVYTKPQQKKTFANISKQLFRFFSLGLKIEKKFQQTNNTYSNSYWACLEVDEQACLSI